MSIRLRKVFKISDKPKPSKDKDGKEYTVINCLSWFPNNLLGESKIPLYQVTPYHLRDPKSGCIFENIWQSVKIYRKVYEQKAATPWDADWNHPAETHIIDDGKGNLVITPEYFAWRLKLANHPKAVRYPNGKQGRHECVCALWSPDNVTWKIYKYFEARKEIYCKLYAEYVKETESFKQLKKFYESGINLELMDVDCPDSIEVTKENYEKYLITQTPAFGHTWTLAACLQGWM